MRNPFQFSKTTVSMRRVELTDKDLEIPGPKTGKVVAVEWQVVYTKDGRESIHLARATEAEADADMDAIKAEADACSRAQVAAELLRGCPEESRSDHETIAQALARGDSAEAILAMPELERWPETYSWLKTELA